MMPNGVSRRVGVITVCHSITADPFRMHMSRAPVTTYRERGRTGSEITEEIRTSLDRLGYLRHRMCRRNLSAGYRVLCYKSGACLSPERVRRHDQSDRHREPDRSRLLKDTSGRSWARPKREPGFRLPSRTWMPGKTCRLAVSDRTQVAYILEGKDAKVTHTSKGKTAEHTAQRRAGIYLEPGEEATITASGSSADPSARHRAEAHRQGHR